MEELPLTEVETEGELDEVLLPLEEAGAVRERKFERLGVGVIVRTPVRLALKVTLRVPLVQAVTVDEKLIEGVKERLPLPLPEAEELKVFRGEEDTIEEA